MAAAASRAPATALCRAAAALHAHPTTTTTPPRALHRLLHPSSSSSTTTGRPQHHHHHHQRRWAQVHDVRFLATTPRRAGVEDRYKARLEEKAAREGHASVGDMREAYRERIAELRRSEGPESVPGLDALLNDEPHPDAAKHEAQRKGTPEQQRQKDDQENKKPEGKEEEGAVSVTPLWKILDLDKARGLDAESLAAVWRMRHAAQPTSLCAAVPADAWAAIEASARAHPSFVLPIPREGAGAEIHFLQWVFDAPSRSATVLFTQLAEFKARGEFAQPHTSVTHYFDEGLARDQGVVLMAGSLVEGRGAAMPDAQLLVMLMQKFYGADKTRGADPAKRALLAEFNRGDPAFTIERLLEESEKIA